MYINNKKLIFKNDIRDKKRYQGDSRFYVLLLSTW